MDDHVLATSSKEASLGPTRAE